MMTATVSRLRFGALLAAALFCAPLLAIAPAAPAAAETLRPEVRADAFARALGQERAGLAGAGSERVSRLNAALRPMARGEVSVATRGTQPEVAGLSFSRPLDRSMLDALPAASGDAQWQCLAEAIYYESRGEPLAGQIAVAEVILNRVKSRQYPNTICGVTQQGMGSGRACQFSYACDGAPERMASAKPRERAQKLARAMIDGYPFKLTDGALHFHATSVSPRWARQMTRTASIGAHRFYRPGARTANR